MPFAKSQLITLDRKPHFADESFRSIRTQIDFLAVPSPIKSILVTSAVAESGKSFVAANLAAVMAQTGRKVILVDADLRRPRLHAIFSCPQTPGFTTAISKKMPITNVLHETPIPNLKILPSGPLPPNPVELLASPPAHDALQQLSQEADLIVLDTSPAIAVTDAILLSHMVDGVLYILRPGHNSRKLDRRAIELLTQVHARLLGVIVNGMRADDETSDYAMSY